MLVLAHKSQVFTFLSAVETELQEAFQDDSME